MTTKEKAKSDFLQLLRTDAKAARKCVKGKECGGRCIPQNWNCRIKGEGDTPPTRGNKVQVTPELRARLRSIGEAKRNETNSRILKSALLLAGSAGVGAALAKRGAKASEVASSATTISGTLSALNPALTLPATLGAIGLTLGSRGQEVATNVGIRQRGMRSKIAVLKTRNKGLNTRIKKKKAAIEAEKRTLEKLAQQLEDDNLAPKSRQRALRMMPLAESRMAKLQGELNPLQQTYDRRTNLIRRAEQRLKPTVSGALKATTRTLNVASSTGGMIRSQRMRNRRNLGLTGSGRRGPKPVSVWQENWLEDSADSRRGGRIDAVEYQGETFSGYNKPKRTPSHPKKSHAVLAKEGDEVRLIRFGQQGVKGSPPRKGESKAYAARRRAFKLRHRRNIAKGRMSAAYWANRVKW